MANIGLNSGRGSAKWRDWLFLGMVAVLPLHTLFIEAWISWKPFLLGLLVLAAADLAEGVVSRTWPYHRKASMALLLLGVTVLIGWPESIYLERYVRLSLALTAGGLVLLVTERRLRSPGMFDRTLGVVFRGAVVMGITAFIVELVAVGALGTGPLEAVNDLPGVYRLYKPAYLEEGFLALTNWHQDPGYNATWSVLWAVLAFMAVFRGKGSKWWWLDGLIIGGLWFGSAMAFSRTGWLSFPLAMLVAAVMVVQRWRVPLREVVIRIAMALATAVILIGAVSLTDRSGEGGDLDLQFAFRASQGWDLVATLTGWFESSEQFEDRFDVSEERADVWPEYWAFFTEHPVTGVGLGVGWVATSISQEPHNLFLELAGELGILGLLAFTILLVTILRSGGGIVGGVALFAVFLHTMTQTGLFESTLWFAAALYLAGANVTSAAPIFSRTQEVQVV